MARTIHPFPSHWHLTVVPQIPQAGDDVWTDKIRLDRGEDGPPQYFPGTVYRAAVEGEAPTHYPDVPNGRGHKGFVLRAPMQRGP